MAPSNNIAEKMKGHNDHAGKKDLLQVSSKTQTLFLVLILKELLLDQKGWG